MNQSHSLSDAFENVQIENQSLLFGVPDTNGTGSDRGTTTPEIPAGQNNTFINNNVLTLHRITNSSVAVLCFATSIIHILIILVLQRCRKMPMSLKLLSMNFMCNSLLFFVFIILVILFLALTEAYTQSFKYARLMCATGIYASHIGATGGLALERLIRITYPLAAARILKQHNVIAYIASTWIIGFFTSISVTLQGLAKCDFILQTCDLSPAVNISRVVVFCTFVFFILMIYYSYIRISNEINSLQDMRGNTKQRIQAGVDLATVHEVDRNGDIDERNLTSHLRNTRNGYRATGYILKIIITFIICHIPILIHVIIFLLFPGLETPKIAAPIQILSFLCSMISFYVSSHFFIWKFKECKLVFMQIFCSWNERLNGVTRERKMEVYDIPMAVRRVTSPGKVHPTQQLDHQGQLYRIIPWMCVYEEILKKIGFLSRKWIRFIK